MLAALGVGSRLPLHHRLLGCSWAVSSIDQPGEVGGPTGEVEAFGIVASHGW